MGSCHPSKIVGSALVKSSHAWKQPSARKALKNILLLNRHLNRYFYDLRESSKNPEHELTTLVTPRLLDHAHLLIRCWFGFRNTFRRHVVQTMQLESLLGTDSK